MSDSPREPFVFVSGFPRSGTAMMMQMLEAGGLPALVDGSRPGDESNPKGYYEYKPVKATSSNAKWLDDAEGKCTKVIAPLLRHLPLTERYKVILMHRDLDEVVLSQRRMMERLSPTLTAADHETLRSTFPRLMKMIGDWLKTQECFEVLPVSYGDVLADPQGLAQKISTFVGGGLDAGAMAAAVDPSLYKSRKDGSTL